MFYFSHLVLKLSAASLTERQKGCWWLVRATVRFPAWTDHRNIWSLMDQKQKEIFLSPDGPAGSDQMLVSSGPWRQRSLTLTIQGLCRFLAEVLTHQKNRCSCCQSQSCQEAGSSSTLWFWTQTWSPRFWPINCKERRWSSNRKQRTLHLDPHLDQLKEPKQVLLWGHHQSNSRVMIQDLVLVSAKRFDLNFTRKNQQNKLIWFCSVSGPDWFKRNLFYVPLLMLNNIVVL